MAEYGFNDLSWATPQAQPAPAPAQAAASGPASPAEIPFDQAVAGHPQAGPSGSFLADLPTRLASAGTDALGGLLSLPRAAAQGVDWAGNKLGADVGADAALASVQQPGGGQLFPDAATARQMAYNTTGATEYVPATLAGRVTQAALSAAPLGGIGGVGAILPTMAGAATGEGAAEMFPDHPVAARLIGFLFGAHSASAVGNAATRAGAVATGTAPMSDLYQAYQRQGIPTTLSGDVTQNPLLQRMQATAAKAPGSEGAIHDASTEAINAWQNAAEQHATNLGPAATMQEAGGSLQTAAQQWLQDWKNESGSRWAAFRQQVPANTQVPVAGFQQALQDVAGNYAGAQNLARTLQSPLAGNLTSALAADTAGTGALPWQTVQATRTALGEMLQGAPVADASQATLKRLYAGLSSDMANGASSVSPAAAEAYNAASAYTQAGHALLEDHLNPILNAASPESAAQYALGQMRLGGTRLDAIDNAMPGQAANLGAAVLRTTAEGGPGALPARFRNISPEAQELLFSSPGAAPGAVNPALQGVQDLNAVSQAMRNTVRQAGNPSGTGAHTGGYGRLISAIELAKEGKEIAGLPGAIAGGVAGYSAMPLLSAAGRTVATNPLTSAMYSAQGVAPFTAPAMLSPQSAALAALADRRTLPGAAPQNPLAALVGVGGR